MTFEVEQKYHVDDPDDLERRIVDLGGKPGPAERHNDSYFNHPCRDFVETKEALRIRRVDGRPYVTYKGPKLPGAIKARKELEWTIAPGDPDGTLTEQLWRELGFRPVATVSKTRRTFRFNNHLQTFGVMMDDVDRLGSFAEIELVVGGPTEVERARQQIAELAARLELNRDESSSYLRMFLALDTPE
ncbi:MAG: class IV adenylate cyclase [Planctomycetota bacterium]